MRRRRSSHPDNPGKSLGIGIFSAIFLIPVLPIVLPLILLYYLGIMVRIGTRRKS